MWLAAAIALFYIAIKELWAVFFPLLACFMILAGIGFWQDGHIGQSLTYFSLSGLIFFLRS